MGSWRLKLNAFCPSIVGGSAEAGTNSQEKNQCLGSSVPLIRAQEQTRVHDRPRLGEWRRHDLPQPVARRRRGGQLGGPRVGAREGEREEGACRRGRAAPLNIFQAQEQTRVHEAPRTRSGVYRSAAGWSGVCPL